MATSTWLLPNCFEFVFLFWCFDKPKAAGKLASEIVKWFSLYFGGRNLPQWHASLWPCCQHLDCPDTYHFSFQPSSSKTKPRNDGCRWRICVCRSCWRTKVLMGSSLKNQVMSLCIFVLSRESQYVPTPVDLAVPAVFMIPTKTCLFSGFACSQALGDDI